MDLTTPALLFSSISLLLLAYTNRFLVVARLIRDMVPHQHEPLVHRQIPILRRRVYLIRNMQTFGVLSFIACTASMFGLFLDQVAIGKIMFGNAVLLLLISLCLSLYEVIISTVALSIVLDGIAECEQRTGTPGHPAAEHKPSSARQD